MNQGVLLRVTSLLTILLLTIHLTSDFVHDAGELSLPGVLAVALVLTVLLWGTLVLAERRSGHVIMLVGALFALAMPVMHLKRATGVVDALARPDAFSFVWILIALAVTGLVSALLCVRGLMYLRQGRSGGPS